MDMKPYENIAERMYNLDLEVHRVLETDLGRVFTDERDVCIRHISDILYRHEFHKIRSEMALINNMIRTVEDDTQKDALLKEYHSIFEAVSNLPKDTTAVVDILDPRAAEHNASELVGKFDPRKKKIICIGREFGSAGTDIGFLLAEKMKVSFYDGEIFDSVSRRLEVEQDTEADYLRDANLVGKKASSESFLRRTLRYHGLSRKDAFFFNQSELICEMAENESFVIIGRCADMILNRKNIPHFNIFIGAPYELRIQRTMAQNHLDHRHAKKLVDQMDRRHARYYNYYTMKKWGQATNYDLCINSASYGIEGSVRLIYNLINAHKEDLEDELAPVSMEEMMETEREAALEKMMDTAGDAAGKKHKKKEKK